MSGNNWRKTGEFSFEIWCSLYADDAGLPQNKRNELLIAANDVDDHLQLFGLFMHVGRGGMRAKTEALFLRARGSNTDGDTSDLILNSGGTVSFCSQFTYLGSIVHEDLSDKHDVANRIKKATAASAQAYFRDQVRALKDKTSALCGRGTQRAAVWM